MQSFDVNILSVSVCTCEYVSILRVFVCTRICAHGHTCGGQRVSFSSRFSSPTLLKWGFSCTESSRLAGPYASG